MSTRGDMALEAQKEREYEDRQASMTREDVVGKVVEIICDQLGCQQEEVDLETSPVEHLGADSLDVVELVMGVEEEFDIEVNPDGTPHENELTIGCTVGQMVDYVCKLKGVTG